MNITILKRILYVICGIAYTMLGLLFIFAIALAPLLTPEFNGQRLVHIPFLQLALYAVMFLVPAVLLFVVAIAHTHLFSSPKQSQYLFGFTAFAIMLQLSIELLIKALGGGIMSGMSFAFSVTPWSKGHTFYLGYLFYLLALAAAIHDAIVCHKRSQVANSIP